MKGEADWELKYVGAYPCAECGRISSLHNEDNDLCSDCENSLKPPPRRTIWSRILGLTQQETD